MHTTAKVGPLPVRLPDLPTVPELWRGATYVIRSLLSAGEDNPKLRKSDKAGTPYRTWGLALAPARISGHQLCSSSTPGCRAGCLYFQGFARLDETIAACRIAKTVALKEHREWFEGKLVAELAGLMLKSQELGLRLAVRLNLTSDVMWEKGWPALFEEFPSVRWYDYSKHFRRMMRFCEGRFPANYHLTFSRSEHNEDEALAVLRAGGNVAVVFRDSFPAKWHGFQVSNGDEHDLRFLDPAGVVVGLKAKGSLKQDTSGFVVDDRPSRLTLKTV